MPSYRLLSPLGDDLGPFRTSTREWTAGDTINRGFDVLVIVNLTAAEPGDDVDGYLVVRPAQS